MSESDVKQAFQCTVLTQHKIKTVAAESIDLVWAISSSRLSGEGLGSGSGSLSCPGAVWCLSKLHKGNIFSSWLSTAKAEFLLRSNMGKNAYQKQHSPSLTLREPSQRWFRWDYGLRKLTRCPFHLLRLSDLRKCTSIFTSVFWNHWKCLSFSEMF